MSRALVATDASKPLSKPQQEFFCELFATHQDFFGNAVDAYIEAFDIDTTKKNHRINAQSAANRLLRNSIVLARINWFLETRLGLNDVEVDKQLAFLIAQSADMRVKMAAIKEYNALKGRVKQKLELSFTDASDEELSNELRMIEEELAQSEALIKQRRASQVIDVPGMPNLTEEQKAARASAEPNVSQAQTQ